MSTPALPPTFSDATPLVNGLALRRDPFAFFSRLAAEVGPCAHYRLPSGVVYFLNDPALIREVLVSQDTSFHKWAFNASLHEIFGEGLLASEGERHQRMQRVAAPAFHPGRLPDYAGQMVALTQRRLAAWGNGGEIDVDREMILLTLDIVAQVLFGVSLGDQLEEVRAASRTAQLLSDRVGSAPDDDRAFSAAVGQLDAVARSILETHRRRQSDDNLLALLLLGQETDPALVTDTQIHQEIRNFLLAGHVTTANVLAAACWHLAREPEMAEGLREHLDATLGDRAPRLEDLPSLAPCEHVFLETLRLHPPVWVLGREAQREVRLGRWVLPEGAKLVIVPWVLHRDRERFPEPDRFRPARWRDDARARLPRGSFLPFSAGARSCLGERFAMLEGTLLLAIIAGQWQFEVVSDAPEPGWSPQVILWPRRGIRLRASRRPVPTLSHR